MSLMIAMSGAADEWTLVTDASDLHAGDQIVLGYVDADHSVSVTATTSLKKTTTTAYLESVVSSFAADKGQITTLGENTAVFTLAGEAGAWKFGIEASSGTVYLGATAIKKLSWSGSTDTWTIAIDANGVATIASTNSDIGQIQYNYNNGTPRFCNYKGTMKDVLIYRGAPPAPQVTIAFDGFPYARTRCEVPTYKAGSTYTLPTFVPEKDGKELVAWQFAGENYAPGATFVVPETDVLFVPVWVGGQGMEEVTGYGLRVTNKVIRDGQLIIIRDGIEYNVLGERIK